MNEVFKVGDIVKIKEFEADTRYNGVLHTKGMMCEIGRTHVITDTSRDGVYKIDEINDYYWASDVFESAETDMKIVHFGFIIEPVSYIGGRWTTLGGEVFSRHDIGLCRTGKMKLPYDIFGVGQKGDEVSVCYYRGRSFLDPKYLPMAGIIREEEDHIAF